MLLTTLALFLQAGTTGTQSLPIPFSPPGDSAVRAALVRVEKSLSRKQFDQARTRLAALSFDNVRYSIDVSAAPEGERGAKAKALEAGAAVWAGKIKLARDDNNPNIRLILVSGFGTAQLYKTVGLQNVAVTCQEFSWNGCVFTSRIFTDEGPEGSPHSDRALAQLAAKAIGNYMGLSPEMRGSDVMSPDDHTAKDMPKPSEAEATYVKSVLTAYADMKAHVDSKTPVFLELPEIAITGDVDFGSTPYGQTMTGEIPFKNVGSLPLHISDLIPDCACVAREWDKEIQPGQSGKIKISIAAKNTRGQVTKHIMVRSDDIENADKVVALHFVLSPAVETYPVRATVELAPAGQQETQFFVYSPLSKPFKVVGVELAGSDYGPSFEPSKMKFTASEYPNLPNEERPGYLVKATVPEPPNAINGIRSYRFRVLTDIEGEGGEATFDVKFIRGIVVTPTNVSMMSRGDERQKRVVLLEQKLGTFNVTGVENESGEIDYTVETLEAGHKYRVWLMPKKDLLGGTRFTKAIIKTDSPTQATIPISIHLDIGD